MSRLPIVLSAVVALAPAGGALAQIRVHPTGVNVNAQGATTVFLSFGGLAGYEAAEAFWCGELLPASPAVGLRCDPRSIFGALPIRYDRSAPGGVGGLTDIMTIPPSVTRRAYQAAASGAASAFFYVRRFRSLSGGPDQYVAVTCRLGGGGARTPLSLTDVQVSFAPEASVLHVAQGDPAPALEARVAYTGTGRLVGRWEVVLPGEELPSVDDLLTEATLPLERRGNQRRYTQLSRFNLFLPPTGSVVVTGPDPERLPTGTDGVYYVLLRIEAGTDKEGDSDLGAAGAGTGVVPAAAVAGFPMPVLRYVVGSGGGAVEAEPAREAIALLSPAPGGRDPGAPLLFTWEPLSQAALYRVEIETNQGVPVLSALAQAATAGYRAPPWLAERAGPAALRWRVVATDAAGRTLGRSAWRALSLAGP